MSVAPASRHPVVTPTVPVISSVAIVIPAHNEAAVIRRSLDAVAAAARHPSLRCVAIDVLVVLDRCADRTEHIVRSCGVRVLPVDFGNVGAARAAGFTHLLAHGMAGTAAPVQWFGSTDADTQVDGCWLAEQVRLANQGADAVFGVIDVDDWSSRSELVRDRFHAVYKGTRRTDAPGHRHVHGASMGIRAAAYQGVGGFAPLRVGEDQDLSDRLENDRELRVVRTTAVRATTSARTDARAPRGFGGFLDALSEGSALAAGM